MIDKNSKFYFDPMVKVELVWKDKLIFLFHSKPDYNYIITETEIINTILNYDENISLIENYSNNNWNNEELFLYDLDFLFENSIIFEEGYEYDNWLSIDEIKYYKNNILFLYDYFDKDWIELQKTLKNKKIAILWGGGWWLSILQHFIWSGIGEIRIIDHDIIEVWNLTRQFFYTFDDVWKYKVDVIKNFISKRNPFIKIKTIKQQLSENTKNEIWNFIEWVDLFINAWDKPSIKSLNYMIQDICFPKNIPFCSWGYSWWQVLPLVIPWKTACFDCFFKFKTKNNLWWKKDIIKIYNSFPSNLVSYHFLTLKNTYIAKEIIKFLVSQKSCKLINSFFLPFYWDEKQVLETQSDCTYCNPK